MTYTIDELIGIGFEPRRLHSERLALPDYMAKCIEGRTLIFKRLGVTDKYALHFPDWNHPDEIDELIEGDNIPAAQYIDGIVSILKSED